MISKIEKALKKALKEIGIKNPQVHLEHPEDISHGDFATNIALIYAKELKEKPIDLAEKIIEELEKDLIKDVESISIAGPGFINIKIKDEYFIKEILSIDSNYGKGKNDKDKKIMVEYTDPNPFKIFHIGHLMANAIGESLSRIVEYSGAHVVRVCYQGDVGLHVAKTIWATLTNKQDWENLPSSLEGKISFLGKMYVLGNEKYESDEGAKKEIIEINKKVFDKSDGAVNAVYKEGRELSLEYFDSIYKKLGTKFDKFFFESEVATDGIRIVEEFLKEGIFEKSERAIVFPGEKYGTHTRVFVTSQGLPTYETKEIGLTKKKFEMYPDLSESIIVTANEQNDYFKVIMEALKIMYPDIARKMKHLSHGILRPSSGKMSSRKGNVVSAEDLLSEFKNLVIEKMKDREWQGDEKSKVAEIIAISALKYVILRQKIGGDIIYDPEKIVSFEGDSGPYLEYACVRANAVVVKAHEAGISEKVKNLPEKVDLLERILVRFPEIVKRSSLEYAPSHIVTYLVLLASTFNTYYANNKIIDERDHLSSYRVTLTKAFVNVMKNGLWLLGIEVPNKM